MAEPATWCQCLRLRHRRNAQHLLLAVTDLRLLRSRRHPRNCMWSPQMILSKLLEMKGANNDHCSITVTASMLLLDTRRSLDPERRYTESLRKSAVCACTCVRAITIVECLQRVCAESGDFAIVRNRQCWKYYASCYSHHCHTLKPAS